MREFPKWHGLNSLSQISIRASKVSLGLFAGGDLEGRKGVAIALQAQALVAKRGIDFRYTIGENGPELQFLKLLSQQLGIEKHVEFSDGFGGEAYVEKLAGSDIYLLPSLRDNAPITLMETMLSHCVPVVADCGGPGEIVTEDCGYRIRPESVDQMSFAIAKQLEFLANNPACRKTMGEAARKRIIDAYGEDHYKSHVQAIYESATRH